MGVNDLHFDLKESLGVAFDSGVHDDARSALQDGYINVSQLSIDTERARYMRRWSRRKIERLQHD